MREPLEYDQILYNEPIYWLEQKWQRRLDEHEKNIAIEIFRWTMTNKEVEELRILDTEWIKGGEHYETK
jgi:hypothetical protein